MSEEERANQDIRVYDHKFKKETWRSVGFGICIALATYLILDPMKARQEYENRINDLQLEFGDHIKRKVFEQRAVLIDEFIVKSDAYTKHVAKVAESANLSDYRAYEEEIVNSYNLQLARLRAAFGDALEREIAEAETQRKKLHRAMRVMKQVTDADRNLFTVRPLEGEEIETASTERDALVKKNIAITRKATELQFSD